MLCNVFCCQPRVLTYRDDHKMPTPAHKTTIQTLPPKFKKHKTQEIEEPENSMDDDGSRDRVGSTINPLCYKCAPPVHTPHSSLTYATLTLTNLC